MTDEADDEQFNISGSYWLNKTHPFRKPQSLEFECATEYDGNNNSGLYKMLSNSDSSAFTNAFEAQFNSSIIF